jgi:hypothetical protein
LNHAGQELLNAGLEWQWFFLDSGHSDWLSMPEVVPANGQWIVSLAGEPHMRHITRSKCSICIEHEWWTIDATASSTKANRAML